ncbi:hypothetical protein BaRGS_00015764 [Batillaria attramentaria]|uniref:TRASH domain-containing protein n=1 Tax=Batillaria attramentaria TaxID=370345 RepID=A0ABD0L0K7_9CAEN
MSQSAENQSAIIENENNANIVMESQAAMSEDRSDMITDEPEAQQVGTPTQDEAEESMEMGDAGDASAAAAGFGDAGVEPSPIDAAGDAGPVVPEAEWQGQGEGEDDGGPAAGDREAQGEDEMPGDALLQEEGNGDAAEIESMEVEEAETPTAEDAEPVSEEALPEKDELCAEEPEQPIEEPSQAEDEENAGVDQVDAVGLDDLPERESEVETEEPADAVGVENVAESPAESKPEEQQEAVDEPEPPAEPDPEPDDEPEKAEVVQDGRSQDASSQDAFKVMETEEPKSVPDEGSLDERPESVPAQVINLDEDSTSADAARVADMEEQDTAVQSREESNGEAPSKQAEEDGDIIMEDSVEKESAAAEEKPEDSGEKLEDSEEKPEDSGEKPEDSEEKPADETRSEEESKDTGDADTAGDEAVGADVENRKDDEKDAASGDAVQTAEGEEDKASDATIEEKVDQDNELGFQVSEVKSGADAESESKDAEDAETVPEKDSSEAPEAMETDQAEEDKSQTEKAGDTPATTKGETDSSKDGAEKTTEDEKPANNDMGIQIESVSGGADDVHDSADQPIKQENGVDATSATGVKKEPGASAPNASAPAKKSAPKSQTCIVCKRVGKCKYNIVRNGDIKHLCDDTCFQKFRTNPTMYLKGTSATPAAAKEKSKAAPAASTPAVPPLVPTKQGAPGYKTCVVCQLMNINTQGQFCMWKGLDFCGEGCLGKFQSGISTSCTLCTAFIPLTARSSNCLRISNEVRPFCSSRCYNDYKQRMRLCSFCQKDLGSAKDSFSAPVGSEGAFRDFCTQACMKKFEDLLSNDVEIIRVEQSKTQRNKCSVCQKTELSKHTVKYNQKVHHLCSDPCLSAFQYANKLDMSACDHCGTLCTTLESSPHFVQFEGQQKRFCSDNCVNNFRNANRKISPCAWCGSQKPNFDMIERLDSNNKFQLFCSLNCLSLYRVNLQAKSNQAVTCDQCLKFVPAQYHLTMSDASVRNFCSYNCVMSFQAQFTKGAAAPAPSTQQTPKHKHNTRGKAAANQPSFPIISNVVSLAPQGGQKVNIKSPGGIPVVVSGAGQSVKTTGAASMAGGQMQQQIIIQPPPPKVVKNKALLCKPFVQTKATSCRPHTQTKDTQTDESKGKPVLIPVPVPIYLPAPMAMYRAPAPTPLFIPIPIPEIQEKIPTDPLEAEILMMAAAVSADGKHSSDSESDEDMLPEVSTGKKRHREDDDDNDADVMPLTSHKGGEVAGEEDMIQMALRMAEEMSGPIADLESAVEAVPINTDPPPPPPRQPTPEPTPQEDEFRETRSRGRGSKRGSSGRRSGPRAPKRPRVMPTQADINTNPVPPEVIQPQLPPADANYHLKFTYGVNAWRHWVMFKNAQLERTAKRNDSRIKLFKTDIMQCTADELNYSLCLFVKEVRKPNGEEYSPDSIYYLCLGIQQYLFENGRIDNIFTDIYFEKFTECLTDLLSKCQPKFNSAGQMVCRIEEEHLWECKQLGAHSPYVLLNTLIYFHTKYFMLKTPEDHMKLSFAHILKYWKKGQPGKGGQPTRSVSLRYYSVSTAKKDGSAPTSTTKKGSKDGIPVYEVTENAENPLRCPVKLYEFYLSKCPESIKNRSDIFYPVPERSCVPDSPVWYSTIPISIETMTKMLTRILLVREIQEAHLHAQPIYV